MRTDHFAAHFATRYELLDAVRDGEEIVGGGLRCRDCGSWPDAEIVNGIPRFVRDHVATESFGLQWHRFRRTQLDSFSGHSLSVRRFWENTKWAPDELRGAVVLEVGSGAGRFTEVLLAAGARVVSFDSSIAVDANWENNRGKGDLLVFQGDLHQIPFPDRYFDYVFCYGVLQHTPNPDAAYRAIFRKLKPGGKISIDYYRKHEHADVWSTPKYSWRPITTRMSPEFLLKVIRWYVPVWLPIDTIIRRIPRIGQRILAHLRIPCWNYIGWGLTYRQRLEWAILDTFDALATTYDFPKTLEEVRAMVTSPENANTDVFYGSNGIVANVTKCTMG